MSPPWGMDLQAPSPSNCHPVERERERERERGKIKQIEKVLEFLEQIHVFFKSKETEAIFFFSAKERELKNYYIISP